MFTGIVEDLGVVIRAGSGALSLQTSLDGLQVGDSLAVNGVCLTVVSREPVDGAFRYGFDVSEETLRVTSLRGLAAGHRVNLERPMSAAGRFGGHYVQGHVDGLAEITSIEANPGSTDISFRGPDELMVYLVPKGSVTIDGISLTVAALDEPEFTVAIIPHTLTATNLSERQVGDLVNLEVDIIAKYVERLYRKEN